MIPALPGRRKARPAVSSCAGNDDVSCPPGTAAHFLTIHAEPT
jgi:hypothetical protein